MVQVGGDAGRGQLCVRVLAGGLPRPPPAAHHRDPGGGAETGHTPHGLLHTATLSAVLRGQNSSKLLHTSGTCPGDGSQIYKIFHMHTCVLSHQIMGPTTVKMAKTGFMRKIANLQLEVPYFDMIVHKCACEKF